MGEVSFGQLMTMIEGSTILWESATARGMTWTSVVEYSLHLKYSWNKSIFQWPLLRGKGRIIKIESDNHNTIFSQFSGMLVVNGMLLGWGQRAISTECDSQDLVLSLIMSCSCRPRD